MSDADDLSIEYRTDFDHVIRAETTVAVFSARFGGALIIFPRPATQ